MGRISPEKEEAFDKDAMLHKLSHELEEANEYIKFLEWFSSTVHKLDKDMYDNASKVAHEMIKINNEKEKEEKE
tara:strand:+ start:184 stop:405 length:222 start_codon:yes stop_codon:yes gene_type:complete